MKIEQSFCGFYLNGNTDEIASFVNELMRALQEYSAKPDEEVMYCRQGYESRRIGEVIGKDFNFLIFSVFSGMKRKNRLITGYSILGYLARGARDYSIKLNGNKEEIEKVIKGTLERITSL